MCDIYNMVFDDESQQLRKINDNILVEFLPFFVNAILWS